MSKHEKALKRERRKADRERRRLRFLKPQAATCPLRGEAMSRGLKPAAAALAAAAAIAGGTQAYASPVRFDNPAGPGHFDWVGSALLDVLSDAASQPPGSPAPGVFNQFDYYGYGNIVSGGPSGALERIIPSGGAAYLIPFASGEMIPSATPNWGDAFVEFYGTSYLPEGVQTYLGIRFDLGSGNQYGWIGVNRSANTLDAFAWGYETEPGVSIPAGAPEPGTLALLAFGAAAALRKRRTA